MVELCRPDRAQNRNELQVCNILQQRKLQTTAALFNRREMKSGGLRNRSNGQTTQPVVFGNGGVVRDGDDLRKSIAEIGIAGTEVTRVPARTRLHGQKLSYGGPPLESGCLDYSTTTMPSARRCSAAIKS